MRLDFLQNIRWRGLVFLDLEPSQMTSLYTRSRNSLFVYYLLIARSELHAAPSHVITFFSNEACPIYKRTTRGNATCGFSLFNMRLVPHAAAPFCGFPEVDTNSHNHHHEAAAHYGVPFYYISAVATADEHPS